VPFTIGAICVEFVESSVAKLLNNLYSQFDEQYLTYW